MATIQDVAKEAGVSTATVSRILHNSSNVLPETRDKVMAVIERLDYHPNRLARQFRTQETGNILILVPELENTFYYEIISGIESTAKEKGYHILIAETHNDVELEEYFFECLKQKQVDGIITFSARLAPDQLEQLSSQCPFIIVCRYYEGMNLPNVAIDNRKASRDITNYLLNLGHRRICCLVGNTDIPLYQDRLNGYKDALKERGIPVLPEMICTERVTIQGGYDAVERLAGAGTDFSAVVACGDTLAIGAIRALKNMGRKVPSDVAVTGFDDIELSSLYNPSLTTVRQPKKQMGIRAMEKLLDLIAGKTLIHQQDILNYELVIRESSGEYIGSH